MAPLLGKVPFSLTWEPSPRPWTALPRKSYVACCWVTGKRLWSRGRSGRACMARRAPRAAHTNWTFPSCSTSRQGMAHRPGGAGPGDCHLISLLLS